MEVVSIDGTAQKEINSKRSIPLSCLQMFAIFDLLEAYLPTKASILHIGNSSLLLPLLESTNRWIVHQYHDEAMLSFSPDLKYFAAVYTLKDVLTENVDIITNNLKILIGDASYLIVIGDCDNSPTDLGGIRENKGLYDFSIVEEICSEDSGVPGVMIFANTHILSQDWFQARHSLTKRLQGRLVSTAYISKKNVDLFV